MKKFQKKIIAFSTHNSKIASFEVKPLEVLLDEYTDNGLHLPLYDRLIAVSLLAFSKGGIAEADARDFLYHLMHNPLVTK